MIAAYMSRLPTGMFSFHQSTVPFWPEKDSKKLKIKVEGCNSAPHSINFHKEENCLLLHLDNTVGTPLQCTPSTLLHCFIMAYNGGGRLVCAIAGFGGSLIIPLILLTSIYKERSFEIVLK